MTDLITQSHRRSASAIHFNDLINSCQHPSHRIVLRCETALAHRTWSRPYTAFSRVPENVPRLSPHFCIIGQEQGNEQRQLQL